ncbi:hypothetical protein CSC70_02760 [Pseudoxanthomonas kalamensis DSM 18571]|uniref:hypothetical protein n=1 Tax=Pseudoxanthomonas kalamensis TaxID=289483 RepID=UPI001390DC44|nr:hypothetical protein [Pseudoxanthomonas kalamensis]KAF1712456.1 hypothetical protein CSC70_02760 [Pseudoxanthomonas kalamensis DSM 18571]
MSGVHVIGVMALELTAGTVPALPALQQQAAGALAGKLGRDLIALIDDIRGLELTFAAAHFDPAEVLRPGWPLHRRLDELRQRAPRQPGDGPRVIVFGADADGQVPLPFQADPELSGGALRVLPFLLSGSAADVAVARERCEEVLLDRGMAQADTALLAQETFGAHIEHARYLTVHDLAALMSMQYQQQGLQHLWPLIETALLEPEAEEWLDAPPEPLLRYAGGEVRMALLDPPCWQRRHAGHVRGDAARMERAYEIFQARQRQLAAILEAHGIPVVFAHCAANDDPRVILQD